VENAMSSRQQRERLILLFATITISIGLGTLLSVAEAGQPHAAAAPIVGLEFDDVTGALWKATPRSLARSLNQGQTWTPVALPALAQGNLVALSISAGRAKTIYAAITGSGVLVSQDGGRTWIAHNRSLPNSNVIALTAHSTQPSTVYAYVVGKGIFQSRNAGATWYFVDQGPSESVMQLAHSNMPSRVGTGWIFAATSKGVRRTMDCFCGWHSAGAIRLSFNLVASDAAWPARVYAAAREGLFISPDGGDHWIRMREPVATVTALVSTQSGRLYGAINGKLISSVNRGVTWEFVVK
jgi:photosystem II stability/assembly factor-like uncharacterized protein